MRSKNLIDRLDNTDEKKWKKIRVECGDNKNRNLLAFEEVVNIPKYKGDIRQISIKGNGKVKPAVIITNDFDLTLAHQLYGRTF